MPLQRLLHRLLPSLAHADPAAAAPDFADTCPDEDHPRAPAPLRQTAPAPRQAGAGSQSTIDLVLGTEVMEYPDDTAADLMDEFFAKSHKRAA
ncbi:MAG: hypothetical protein ACJ8GJ_15065 [Vitreoscilla sp.]